jgi:hypothetical protein
MLVFKNNIYAPVENLQSGSSGNQQFDSYDFIFNSLLADRDLFLGLAHLDREEGEDRFRLFFPHASRFGSLGIINSISKQLLEGLVNPDKWYQMNAYHLCYLYDSLASTLEEYSYETPEQRVEMFPDLNGEPIDFDEFLETHFMNTAFLIDEDRFNSMDSQEKENRGFVDSCLFGAINRLVPSKEEIELKQVDNPYT